MITAKYSECRFSLNALSETGNLLFLNEIYPGRTLTGMIRKYLLISLMCNILYCDIRSENLLEIKGGTFRRGKEIARIPDQSPPNEVSVSSFYYQSKLVTVREYEEFQKRTGHITVAEKKGYCMTSHEGMKEWEWEKVKGADYRNPFLGNEDTNARPKPDWPAVCLSYSDAAAYCAYIGMRLPSEAEWEYAHRAGSASRFPWGERPEPEGNFLLNYWQGKTHRDAESKDGFKYLSSVNAFPPNRWGVYDSVGNVWQITLDYYAPEIYRLSKEYSAKNGKPVLDPVAYEDRISFHDEISPKKRLFTVTRGGSWWCSERTCNGYGLIYRGKILEDTVFSNNGFRCAKKMDKDEKYAD